MPIILIMCGKVWKAYGWVFPGHSSSSSATNSSSAAGAPGDISQKGATMSSSSPNFCVCAASLHSLGNPPNSASLSQTLFRPSVCLSLPLVLTCSFHLLPPHLPSFFRLSSIYFSFSFVLICRLIHCDSIAVVLVLQSPCALARSLSSTRVL